MEALLPKRTLAERALMPTSISEIKMLLNNVASVTLESTLLSPFAVLVTDGLSRLDLHTLVPLAFTAMLAPTIYSGFKAFVDLIPSKS